MTKIESLPLPLIAKAQVMIQKPRAAVFKWLVDFENNYPRFFPGVIEMTALDNLPIGALGKRYRELVDLGPKKEALELSITKIIENQEIQIEPEVELFMPTFQFLFLAIEPEVTEFHWRFYSRVTDPDKISSVKNTVGKLLGTRAIAAMKNLSDLTEIEL